MFMYVYVEREMAREREGERETKRERQRDFYRRRDVVEGRGRRMEGAGEGRGRRMEGAGWQARLHGRGSAELDIRQERLDVAHQLARPHHPPHLPPMVQGSGCRVQGAGFRVQGSGFRVQGAWFRVQGAGFRVHGSGCRVQGAGCRVQGSGCRVQGAGFMVQDTCHPVTEKVLPALDTVSVLSHMPGMLAKWVCPPDASLPPPCFGVCGLGSRV